MHPNKGLTRKIRHGSELFSPVLGYLNRLLLLGLTLDGHPLFIGVAHYLLQVVRMGGVQDVEKIFTRWTFILGVFVRKV